MTERIHLSLDLHVMDRIQQAADDALLDFAEGFDRRFSRMAFHSRRVGKKATRMSVMSRVASAARTYARLDAEGALFPRARAARPEEVGVRPLVGGRVVDLSWPSAYRGLDPAHRRVLQRCTENATCHARWYRHDRPAPTILCVHGWGVGYLPLEARNFSADLFYRMGMDVALFVLPFHARRAPKGRLRPMFPVVDPVRTNEGFAQAILDLRSLMAYLKGRGAPQVGITGMSLGGFTSALLATVEPELAFAVPQIPFPSLAELLIDHMEGSANAELARARGLENEALMEALAPTTPSRRRPVIDGERVLILAGERDRVTPMPHAVDLHHHFAGSRLMTFPGAHVIQLGRAHLLRDVLAFIAGLGIPLSPERLQIEG